MDKDSGFEFDPQEQADEIMYKFTNVNHIMLMYLSDQGKRTIARSYAKLSVKQILKLKMEASERRQWKKVLEIIEHTR